MLKVNATKEYARLISMNIDANGRPVSVVNSNTLGRRMFNGIPYHIIEGCLPCFNNWFICEYCEY